MAARRGMMLAMTLVCMQMCACMYVHMRCRVLWLREGGDALAMTLVCMYECIHVCMCVYVKAICERDDACYDIGLYV